MKPEYISGDGRHLIITSVKIEKALHTLVKENKLNLTQFVNNALISYFGLEDVEKDLEKIRSTQDLIKKQRELDKIRSENAEKRVKIAEIEAKNAKIDQDLKVLSEKKKVLEQENLKKKVEKRQKADQIVAEKHLAKLDQGWKTFVKTRKHTINSLKKRLPENDYQVNYMDFWPAVVQELEKTTGETFSEAEVVEYCRVLARGEA